MSKPTSRRTPRSYWFLAGAAFEFAGAITITTTSLRWLSAVALVAGVACLLMGMRASWRQ